MFSRTSVMVLASVVAAAGLVGGQPAQAAVDNTGQRDPSFTPLVLNSAVSSVAVLSDGKYLIGGSFTDAGGAPGTDFVARLKSSGLRDATFAPPTLNNEVYSVAALSDGKYLIGGYFTNVGGDPGTDFVARLNSNGTRDTSFTPPPLNDNVRSVAGLPDGKYLIGGYFTDAGGDPGTDFVARLNSNGTRDTTFIPPTLYNVVSSVAVLPDGKYLIGGAFTDVGDDPNTDKVARLNSNGTRDTTFTPPTLIGGVFSVAVLPDGKYLIGGSFTDVGGDPGTDFVARLNSNGTRDTTFTPSTLNNQVMSMALLPDGKYLIGGDFDDVGGDNGTDKVARLNSNGTRDITFTPPTLSTMGPNAVSSVAVLPDGKYLIGGSFTNVGGDPNTDKVARLGMTVLAVDAVTPASGSAGGGTQVIIGGTGFEATATATIGGHDCAVVGATAATTLTCTTAAHTPGTVDVTVTNPDGRFATLTGAYAYQPVSVPQPPTAVTGVAGDTEVTVSWTPSGDDGGSPVLEYVASEVPGGATCTSSTTSCTITGLTNGTGYTFTVTARNAIGTSNASAPSAPVTPRSVAAAPDRGDRGGRGHEGDRLLDTARR